MLAKIHFIDKVVEVNFDIEKSDFFTGNGVLSLFDKDTLQVFSVSLSNPNVLYVEYDDV